MVNHCISITDIRDVIKSYLNCSIIIEAHKSKKKVYQKNAVIKEVYSNIFIVELQDCDIKNNRLSFSYTDLLTKAVKIIPIDGSNEVLDLLNEE